MASYWRPTLLPPPHRPAPRATYPSALLPPDPHRVARSSTNLPRSLLSITLRQSVATSAPSFGPGEYVENGHEATEIGSGLVTLDLYR